MIKLVTAPLLHDTFFLEEVDDAIVWVPGTCGVFSTITPTVGTAAAN